MSEGQRSGEQITLSKLVYFLGEFIVDAGLTTSALYANNRFLMSLCDDSVDHIMNVLRTNSDSFVDLGTQSKKCIKERRQIDTSVAENIASICNHCTYVQSKYGVQLLITNPGSEEITPFRSIGYSAPNNAFATRVLRQNMPPEDWSIVRPDQISFRSQYQPTYGQQQQNFQAAGAFTKS